jgi:adenosylcobinamide-phosphate synthase
MPVTVAPWELLAAVTLDLALGDPRWLPHPIRGIGWLIQRAERFWRWTRLPLRAAGAMMWICVAGTAACVVWFTLPWLNVYWIWMFLALRGLDVEALNVVRALDSGNLDDARAKLSMIVGRDTANLDAPAILRAVIETVSENTNDGIIAPLFYLLIGGPAAMALYKAANTMDSMVGYRCERYSEFGWFAARMDDVLNLIPARLTAVLVWMSALLPGLDARRSARITLRDGMSHPSPNAGYPEAAYAGALGIRLGGMSTYAGVASHKPFLGDPDWALSTAKFRDARKLLYATSFLMIGMAMAAMR